MLQNKIYHNYLIEIFRTFLIILFGLSMIFFTVRAVNFLDLIVYSNTICNYLFQIFNIKSIWYSANICKFIPFCFNIGYIYIKAYQDSALCNIMDFGSKKDLSSKSFFCLLQL